MNTKRVLTSLLAGAVVCGMAWIGGFDFNERGDKALITTLFALWVSVMVYAYPGWSER